MDEKPLILLDIDGCVNAFRFVRQPGTGQPVYRRKTVAGYRIMYRPEWAAWVSGMAAVSEIHWASMWQDNAVELFAPSTGIGREIDRYIDFHAHHDAASSQRTGSSVGEYKHPGIVATVGDRPFVWIDDDISPRQHRWAVERAAAGLPTLLLQPSPAVGLTEDHVARAREFLTACAVTGPARTIAG